MIRLIIVTLIAAMLISGCVVVQTGRAKVWLLCYQDDTMLANGMYANNELKLKCNGRRQLNFSYKVGQPPVNNTFADGMKEYVNNH